MDFKLTYSTMFNPPPELHERFEAALTKVRASLGKTYANFIDGADRAAEVVYELRSPIDRNLVLGQFSDATAGEVDRAMAAAKKAFPAWKRTPAAERSRILCRVA